VGGVELVELTELWLNINKPDEAYWQAISGHVKSSNNWRTAHCGA